MKKLLFFISLVLFSSYSIAQKVTSGVPRNIHKNGKYLFYLHGKIVEDQGRKAVHEEYGPYLYDDIINSFKHKGFHVISEVRPKESDVETYAQKIVYQIQELIAHGVNPRRITVVGASKGAVIAMFVSTFLKNNQISYVLVAGCSENVIREYPIDLTGNILSVFEASDPSAGTCIKFFEKATNLHSYLEIKTETGIKHKIVFKPYDEWVIPAVDWANTHAAKVNKKIY